MTDKDMQRLWTEASDIANKLSDMRSIDTDAAYKSVRHSVRRKLVKIYTALSWKLPEQNPEWNKSNK